MKHTREQYALATRNFTYIYLVAVAVGTIFIICCRRTLFSFCILPTSFQLRQQWRQWRHYPTHNTNTHTFYLMLRMSHSGDDMVIEMNFSRYSLQQPEKWLSRLQETNWLRNETRKNSHSMTIYNDTQYRCDFQWNDVRASVSSLISLEHHWIDFIVLRASMWNNFPEIKYATDHIDLPNRLI